MDMDPRLTSSDLGYVYKYMKVKNQIASGFENDLEMTIHAPASKPISLTTTYANLRSSSHQRPRKGTPKSGKRFSPLQNDILSEQEGRRLLQILRNDMSKDEQCFQNDIRKLRNKLKDQELELKRMQDTINSLKEQTAHNTSKSGIEVTVNLSKNR
ncbi:unnamed protein product [Heligmosomoides polygyrus]|uniref:FlxA-like protein n=1 Tax=Heligmosomoides polygyrus TaxID=6339 RepID=A0A183GP79_HELPZ|nr:unnamed protein product [Heligmosomoides polygyrus]